MKTRYGYRRGLACFVVAVFLAAGCGGDEAIDFIPVAKVPKTGPPTKTKLVCSNRAQCTEKYCDQVLIPAGKYRRGDENAPITNSNFTSGDGRPVHDVELDHFCIDKYEVTLERYENCVDAKACKPAGLKWRDSAAPYETTVNHYPGKCWPDRGVCKHHAVNGKNYWQAHEYCTWIGARLCTEAEWERVANGPGPQRRKHPWGNQTPTTALVNLPATGSGFVEPVDSHATGKSAEGVFNVAGNVYEWVRDAYAPYKPAPAGEMSKNPSNAPKTAADKVVMRGSCFFTKPGDTVTQRSVVSMAFDWG